MTDLSGINWEGETIWHRMGETNGSYSILDSDNFQLECVSRIVGYFGFPPQLKWKMDQRPLMAILLNILEKHPTSVKEAAAAMDDWIKSSTGGPYHCYLPSVKMGNDWVMGPEGKRKSLIVKYFNRRRGITYAETIILFRVKKKIVMKSLRSLATEKVAGCLEEENDVEKLKIPDRVKEDVVGAMGNDWRGSE